MPKLTVNEIREKYLTFFERQGHVRVPSASLVPENDPTTLFTGSGMQPMVPYLLGQKHPLGKRITDSQKSFRTADIEEVGDNRHTTFFEMLGNWSLGDYFKREQLQWIFEFVTDELGLDPTRLYVTVFEGLPEQNIPKDEESARLWQELFKEKGIDAKLGERIVYYDAKKNWWSRAGIPSNMPVGELGGPDSELFWDFGAELKLHRTSPWKDQLCHVNCDCGRFLEIGNNVFMEYLRTETGFEPLKQKNVDFGGGLERLAAAVNDNPDVFLIDVFTPLREHIVQVSKREYGRDAADTKAFRVIMDHIRAATFLISDGVAPSNKDQGYFVRRLIRRAIRYGHHLGITHNFTGELIEAVVAAYGQAYPELPERQAQIQAKITKEEEKFRKTLAAGLRVFSQALDHEKTSGQVSGKTAFDLYQSYGFPVEMTEELAREAGLTVDATSFKKSFAQHQQQSRASATQKFKGGLADHSEQVIQYHTATHLLHQALRTILGDHVLQRGSNITKDRLRFDFSHSAKLTDEEIKQTQELVNQQIQADLAVSHQEMTVAEAKQKGALGVFEHKYGDTVNVYSVGDFSHEICGGPHVQHTGELGQFTITKEESAGAGIRRIKAVLE